MTVTEAVADIRERIDTAARAAGKRGSDITFVGASKTTDAAACREAIAAGIDALGENRVQEMLLKLEQHAYDGAPLHFIGHLQRNKVRQVVGTVALIQSAGSVALLQEIEKAAAAYSARMEAGTRSAGAGPDTRSAGAEAAAHTGEIFVQPVLLEVNIGEEAAKSGFLPGELAIGAETALSLPHVRVDGLMAIPPADASPAQNRAYFDKVHALYVDMSEKLFHNKWTILSMGMSGDFEDAVRAGATMVRIGSSVFGARPHR